MATKKKEAPVQEPVSAELNIRIELFGKPENHMLGTAIAFDTPNGKFQRLAHTYVMDNEPPEISLERVKGGKQSIEDLDRYLAIMALYNEKLKELYATL